MLKSKPFFKSCPKALVSKPIKVGPVVQPISPETAKNANISVEVEDVIFVVKLIVAGHIAETEKPQTAQPTSDNQGTGDKHASKYVAIHSIAEKATYLSIETLELILLNTILPIPIRIANANGPAKSPTVLETFSPVSAKVDAH